MAPRPTPHIWKDIMDSAQHDTVITGAGTIGAALLHRLSTAGAGRGEPAGFGSARFERG